MASENLIDQITAAIDTHAEWRLKLTQAIRTGTCCQSPNDIACDDKCAFGKWLYGSTLDATAKASKPYQVTQRLHAEFHEVAGEVAQLATEGRPREAYELMDSVFNPRSERLDRALTKWRGELGG